MFHIDSAKCTGCGACSYICPEDAISEVGREIGIVEIGRSRRIEFIHGKLGVGEALRITQDDVLKALGGLPEDSLHCALLAATTLRETVRDCLALKKEPWKRAYRRH
ncbi:MAG: hypothetical protein E3J81_08695 [Dehalococcoidia bacterium]|nr:MAG: hypothetical protein E3J81_08695 [Dehalococcoidia bacterium]